MMTNYKLSRPALIVTYGIPGSGKTSFARHLAENIGGVHLQSDKIRNELFEKPRFDDQENAIVEHLMQYMAEEFLAAGMSVIYDGDSRTPQIRRNLKELARERRSFMLVGWLQIDTESAFARLLKRDRRKSDDKYAANYSRPEFEAYLSSMKNPSQSEEYVVISGKHNFQTQLRAVVKRLYDAGLLTADNAVAGVVKPGLVNLVPFAGRVDNTRRNISVR